MSKLKLSIDRPEHRYECRCCSKLTGVSGACRNCGAPSEIEGRPMRRVAQPPNDRLACLSHNLAVAAGLCEAFESALEEAEQHRLYHEFGYRLAECWSPGCGREAPR